jgi:hypothetical protein
VVQETIQDRTSRRHVAQELAPFPSGRLLVMGGRSKHWFC